MNKAKIKRKKMATISSVSSFDPKSMRALPKPQSSAVKVRDCPICYEKLTFKKKWS